MYLCEIPIQLPICDFCGAPAQTSLERLKTPKSMYFNKVTRGVEWPAAAIPDFIMDIKYNMDIFDLILIYL